MRFRISYPIKREVTLRLFSSDAFFYVRLHTCAQYASMNEFTCFEHSVRIRRSKKTHHWKIALNQTINTYQIYILYIFVRMDKSNAIYFLVDYQKPIKWKICVAHSIIKYITYIVIANFVCKVFLTITPAITLGRLAVSYTMSILARICQSID